MMTSKPDIQQLFNVWEENKMITKTPIEFPQMDMFIPSIFSSGPMYYYIIDFYDMSISNVSDSIRDIHGLDPNKVTFTNILELIHPDDIAHVAKSENLALDMFYNKIGFENGSKYKVSYCLRFKTADSSYKLFLHQSIILSTDPINNKVSKCINIHTDISHVTQHNNYHTSLIGIMGEPSYINIGGETVESNPAATNKCVFFSKREIEILKLISEGLTNVAIAAKLNLAKDTIKNHRRNIMEKAGVNNTAKLIKKCMLEGII